ncbi:hypothetical protein [Dyadobacter luteus]|jgi:hypothetical protein|nr:hypothetical protein [Dyadobacter luteus]
MAAAIYISMLILLWYGIKEAKKSKPNWHRAVVSTMMWPFTIFYKDR